jgi:hypothetical protein
MKIMMLYGYLSVDNDIPIFQTKHNRPCISGPVSEGTSVEKLPDLVVHRVVTGIVPFSQNPYAKLMRLL